MVVDLLKVDPTKLPGALLFLTLTTTDTPASKTDVIMYDTNYKSSDTVESIAARLNDKLPYYETFTMPGQVSTGFEATHDKTEVFYIGTFGGPRNPDHPSSASLVTWDHDFGKPKQGTVAATGTIADGIVVAFWNQYKVNLANNKEEPSSGLFTNAVGKGFNSNSKVGIMGFHKVVSERKLKLSGNVLMWMKAKEVMLDFYATHDGTNTSLDTPKLIPKKPTPSGPTT